MTEQPQKRRAAVPNSQATQFGPGNRANPGGRPKAIVAVQELARQHTPAAISALAEIVADKRQPGAARVSAAGELLDRGWGRAPQTVKLEGPEALTDEQLGAAIAARLQELLAAGGPADAGAGGRGAPPPPAPGPDGVVH